MNNFKNLRHIFHLTLWLCLSFACWMALSREWGIVPALGPLLDLRSGVWHHQPLQWRDQDLAGLTAPVEVGFDASGVPHIFAQNEADLYLVQGFVVASQRLFQMDVYARLGSARLSELAGERAAPVDQFFTQFGMRRAERLAHAELQKNPQTRMMVESYLKGVNQHIQQLADLPVEYKILGRRPEAMSTDIVSSMSKVMTFNLSGNSADLQMTLLRAQLSKAQILDLFPEFLPPEYEDVVFPKLQLPGRVTEEIADFNSHFQHLPEVPRPPGFNGSNNWAVNARKSATGYSILANDTHLGLSLPNVWYEVQLSCPEFNVYGAGFPNVPGIVNGFNRDIAWGPTNGTTDVLDYYEVEFESEVSLRYRDRGQWRTADVDTEVIRDRHGGSAEVLVPWTKWGPVLHREGKYGLVARWTGHDPSNELLAVRQLYHAKNVRECLSAFELWQSPIQNFVCADARQIGLVHAGHIPLRKVNEGRFIQSPEQTHSQLAQFFRAPERPQVIDPPEGYLLSANQRILPQNNPYLGASYEDPFRGRRIRHLLESKAKLSGEDLMAIQNDDLDGEAAEILPLLLRGLVTRGLSEEQIEAVKSLKSWDHRARAEQVEPTLYKAWYQNLKRLMFEDDWTLPPRFGVMPTDMRLSLMLHRLERDPQHPDHKWIDNSRTSIQETLPHLIKQSWLAAWYELQSTLGPAPKEWKWQRWNLTKFTHVGRFPGFGNVGLPMNGAADSVRGQRGWHGAVYKLVVELGPQLRAWIQIPGGNSGDPLSNLYDRFVEDWTQGKMRSVEFFRDREEAKAKSQTWITFRPEEAP